jgi:exosortase A
MNLTSSAPVCDAEPTLASQRQSATMWIQSLAGLALADLATLFLLRSTAASMVKIWYGSSTYSYGFVVIPIAAYLAWRCSKRVKILHPAPSLFGLALVLLCAVIWVAGNVADVQVVQQFAFVGLLEALVWAFLGTAAVRTLRFPLLFLFFAVPAGQSLVGPLQRLTAAFAVNAVRFSGIPAVQNGLVISTPSGQWRIAEACSGIRYLTSSLLVGVLFAGIAFRNWKRRVALIVVSALVPVLANAVRAYLIILLAYLSNNRLATGVDHVMYGWVFFSLVTALLIGFALRWREPEVSNAAPAPTPTPVAGAPARVSRPAWWLLAVAVLIGLSASYTADFLWSRTAPAQPIEKLWTAPADWLAADDPDHDWAPHFESVQSEMSQTFTNGPREVSLYIATYPATRRGVELVNPSNMEVSGSWELLDSGHREVTMAGKPVNVAEYSIALGGQRRIIWMWYRAGDQLTAKPYVVKLTQAESRLAGRPEIVSLFAVSAMSGSEQATDDLQSFVRGMAFSGPGENVH